MYYPQMMMFPYAASRAWREGPVRAAAMTAAMRQLLRDLLDLQDAYARTHPLKAGAFPGGEDRTIALSTALGLSALLHFGEGMARDIGESDRYRRAVDGAVHRLLKLGRKRSLHPDMVQAGVPPVSWEAGLFFSASFQDLAHWRSEALSTAMAMEALAKYALEYDRDDAAVSRRLALHDAGAGRWRLFIADGQ